MNKGLSLIFSLFLVATSVHAGEKMKPKDVKWLEGISDVKSLGCDSYEDSSYSTTGRDNLEISKSSFKEKKLYPDSKLTCDLWAKTDDINQPVLNVIEEFKIDGVDVNIYHSDASGTIGKNYSDRSAWSSSCKTDAMSDEVSCYVRHGSFYLFKSKAGYTILIGSDHFPGSDAYLRIGKGKPYLSGKDGAFSSGDSLKIVDSISKESSVSTRYIKWPYETPIDENLDTKYFEQAKKILELIYTSHI